MNNLDSLNIAKLDPFGLYHDITAFGSTLMEGYQVLSKMPIPSHYIKVKKVVVTGMGGSGIAASLLKGLIESSARLPFQIVSNYTLPNYVDNETLVIGISYSGNTEETIEAFIDAYKRGARLIGIGTGGKLEDLARKYTIPFYRHPGTTCGQPRMAVPRHLGALLSLSKRFGLFELEDRLIIQARDLLDSTFANSWSSEVPTLNNLAKKIAYGTYDKIPIIWGSDHLEALAHRFKADFNENTKSLSYFEPLPEMNHKSLAGSEFPKPLIKNIFHLLLTSKFIHKQNQIRVIQTNEFFKKRHYLTEIVDFKESQSPLSDLLLGLSLSGLASFYAATLYGIDPAPVVAVEEFKKNLRNS